MVDRAMERVRSLGGRQRTDQDELEQRREECGQRLEKVQRALKEFEKALENTRASVGGRGGREGQGALIRFRC